MIDAVAGALDDASVMRGDGWVDQVAAQRPEPRKSAVLVRAGEPAIADDIRDQDRGKLPGFRHGGLLEAHEAYHKAGSAAPAST